MKNTIWVGALMLFISAFSLYATEIHVSVTGNDQNNGTANAPFRTIQAAAGLAMPGDTVTVHKGTYREYVNPPRGGISDVMRITYRAAPDEEVIIKGSEVINSWEKVGDSLWKAVISNNVFGDYHPYQILLEGDWLNKKGMDHHTGEVFLNGKALFEKSNLDEVRNPQPYPDARDKDASLNAWYCETDAGNTTIWANFQGADPNNELVEISVRKSCFYPDNPGRDFITVQGFTMTQAATQWAAPTAEQIGLIGTHWSKGWVIENNHISNSKCVGIALGKERSTGQDVWMHNPLKDGATHYNEVIFRALEIGWSREHIGSHIVRNNVIFSCGQAGIVGSLGAVFSQIYDNHIYDIWTRRIFSGAEMAGIKIHASIDMVIRHNRIHNTGRGIWIDWMAQGTRITRNLLYDNTTDDLFSEVNHGPYLVDNNLLLSNLSIKDWSEGGAFVHNIIAGSISVKQVPDRFTPYHLPHSTRVKGLRNIYNGDNRFYNNIFVDANLTAYDAVIFKNYSGGNLYYGNSKKGENETGSVEKSSFTPHLTIEERSDGVYLAFNTDKSLFEVETALVTTQILGMTIVSEAPFENRNLTHFNLNSDYFGNTRDGNNPSPGAFAKLDEGQHLIKVW